MQQRVTVGWVSVVLVSLLVAMSALVACRRGSSVEAQASSSEITLGVGQFTLVAKTKYLSAPAVITNYEGSVLEELGSLGKRSKEGQIRNYLFLDPDTLESHWLLPHSNFLFVTRDELPLAKTETPAEGAIETVPKAKPVTVAQSLYYELVKANTNDNKVLDAGDRKTIALSEMNGVNFIELINDIDGIAYRQMQNPDEMLVIYEKGDKVFATRISVTQRRVIATKEVAPIPKIQQPLS